MPDLAHSLSISGNSPHIIDADLLAGILAELSDAELNALEDDLDFCRFAGVPTERVLKLLGKMINLDEGWSAQLRVAAIPALPPADFLFKRSAIKRANRNTRAFQPLSYCA